MMLFTTQRLLVRKLCKDDLAHFYALQSSRNVMQYVGGNTMTIDEIKKDLENIISLYDKPDNDFWIWAVLLKADEQFTGTCALVKSEKGEDEIGFRFLEAFWGRGYGKELVGGFIRYLFNDLKLKRIVAYADRENKGSVKILEHYFNFVEEAYNEKEKCTDRFYTLNHVM